MKVDQTRKRTETGSGAEWLDRVGLDPAAVLHAQQVQVLVLSRKPLEGSSWVCLIGTHLKRFKDGSIDREIKRKPLAGKKRERRTGP